jgi:hypothetical protein
MSQWVQVSMDTEEICDESIEVSIWYAGSMGTALWAKICNDHTKVSFVCVDLL